MLDAATERLLEGRVLGGRYRIGAVIGRGGMSTVFSATDDRLGREVALKVIALRSRSAEETRHFRERFRREAAAAAQIPPHPNVVQVYDYGTDAELDLDFIVMERLRGRDVKQAVAAGGLPAPEATRVLIEAARGLAAGHRAGFVHRDVKPANIFLVGGDAIEVVKVLDFGIARAIAGGDDELTQAGAQPLSPAYASPEQRAAAGPVGPASDVYQLGLVAYELFTGRRAESDGSRIAAGEAERELLGAGAEAHVAAAVRAALDDDAGRRPADAARFATTLAEPRAAAQTAGVLPAPPPPPPAADADDATILEPTAGPAPVGGPVGAPVGVPVGIGAGAPAGRAGGAAGRSLRTVAVAAGLVGLVVGGAVALRGGGGQGGEAMVPVNAALYDETFRALYSEAADELQREASPQEGEAAAAAVQRVLLDLYQSLVLGDLDRHMAHYAERVEFDGERRVRRSSIRRERERLVERFEERELTVERHAITFPEPGRARALVDQRWRFGSGRRAWQGATRQEVLLRLDDGHWRVVAERDVEGEGWRLDD